MAFGASTLTDLSGAVSDLFGSSSHSAKAQGYRIEADNYDLASDLALQNEKFTETSTAIKQAQTDRSNYLTLGGQRADIAGAGFADSGSALDLMRDSASQGSLIKAVGMQQGLITEEGYKEQATSYTNMAAAARVAANAEDDASKGSMITGALKGVAAIATLFA